MATIRPSVFRQVTRILLVDDHPVVRMGLGQILSSEPGFEICGEASTAGDALQLIQKDKPDVVLIDITLQDGSGIELIKQVKALDGGVKMIAVSMHDDLVYAERALRAGAMGYINKHDVSNLIVEAVHGINQGKIQLSPKVADRLLRRAIGGGTQVLNQSPVDCLSDRELGVFEMIGSGMTSGEIAGKLHLSIKTIETHRENIKLKLKLKNANELMRCAVQWCLETHKMPTDGGENKGGIHSHNDHDPSTPMQLS